MPALSAFGRAQRGSARTRSDGKRGANRSSTGAIFPPLMSTTTTSKSRRVCTARLSSASGSCALPSVRTMMEIAQPLMRMSVYHCMTRLTLCALALLLSATPSYAADKKDGISISFSSEDSRTELGPRRDVRDARTAITTRDGSVTLLLMSDVVAVQLTDRALANISTKDDANFLEELIASGVRVAMRKAVEVPIAS